uniref:Uncharacterized protein n=1 Tax=Corethron hystrix TaxID=216773 RepID=A0A7S1C0R8_9STRA|mmetsp:Transcript_944/g.1850  ORF Transcript_944/g.1850 Transcript_944/m.1850 type:complete len:125 (+) Transcript_944:60-434(+)
MKVSTCVSVLLAASLTGSSLGFSGSPTPAFRTKPSALLATPHANNEPNHHPVKAATSIVAAVALGFGLFAETSFAVPPSATLSTSVTVSVGGEFADFSMPSYRAALDVPYNTNLSGFAEKNIVS